MNRSLVTTRTEKFELVLSEAEVEDVLAEYFRKFMNLEPSERVEVEFHYGSHGTDGFLEEVRVSYTRTNSTERKA